MPHPRVFIRSRLWRHLPALAMAALLAWGLSKGGLAAPMAAPAQEKIMGRYVIVESLAPNGAAPYGGTVDFTPRRAPVFSANWRLDNGKRLRGLGLNEGGDLLAVSLNTGAAAYGLAIYRRDADGKRWRGPWITSIDSGGTVGEISFETADASAALAGRHAFTGQRGRMGAFSGTVNIARRGEGFSLNFTTSGGVALYRGVGVLCGEDRLVVAWSFGGTPSVVVYQPNDKKGLAGKRLTLPRSREEAISGTERLAREGVLEDTIFPPLLPTPGLKPAAPDELPSPVPADNGGSAAQSAITLLPPKNAAPDVKTQLYTDLMRRHYRDGLAARWLREQLTPEERALLAEAVRPRPTKPGEKSATSGKTVAQLIEERRAAKSASGSGR